MTPIVAAVSAGPACAKLIPSTLTISERSITPPPPCSAYITHSRRPSLLIMGLSIAPTASVALMTASSTLIPVVSAITLLCLVQVELSVNIKIDHQRDCRLSRYGDLSSSEVCCSHGDSQPAKCLIRDCRKEPHPGNSVCVGPEEGVGYLRAAKEVLHGVGQEYSYLAIGLIHDPAPGEAKYDSIIPRHPIHQSWEYLRDGGYLDDDQSGDGVGYRAYEGIVWSKWSGDVTPCLSFMEKYIRVWYFRE